jgi:hypothetical protein
VRRRAGHHLPLPSMLMIEMRNTIKRLNFKVTFQNIKDFLRIRKEMKRENPRLILQYLPNETNHAKTTEFKTLRRRLA